MVLIRFRTERLTFMLRQNAGLKLNREKMLLKHEYY